MKHLARISFFTRDYVLRLRCQEKGATATEYGITVGFIAIVIVAGVGIFGLSLNGLFGFLTTGIKTALGIP